MNVREALDNIYKEFEKTYEEALNEGYETGFEEGYKNGANDAWALAKDLTLSIKYDYLTRDEIFGYTDVENILNLTGAQALADLKEFEAKQKVFKVGDRVETTGDRDRHGVELFPVGTIGEVMEVDCDGDCLVMPYEEYRAPYYYPTDALELANDVFLVGDEVYLLDKNYRGVVTAVWEHCGVLKTETLTQSGKLSCTDAKDLHRTGRRFPEIANILKQMQEGNE